MSEQAAATVAPTPNAAEAPVGEDKAPVSQGADAPAPPKQKAPAYRKFKDVDEEFSMSDEDVIRERKRWKGADAKFREAAEARKAVEDFNKKFHEDPEAVLNSPNLPAAVKKKLAEKWLVTQIESELNPPDPRDAKLSETEKKLKEYQDREAAEKQTAEEGEKTKVMEQRKAALSDTLGAAMKATQLSADPESAAGVLREMAMYMRAAKERGEDVTPQELVEHIHNTRFRQLYTLAHQFEGEELLDFLGDEIASRVGKAHVARIKAKRDQGQSHKSEAAPRDRNSGRFAPRMDSFAARAHAKKVLG